MLNWGDEVYEERSLIRGGVTALSHVFLAQLARVRAVRLMLHAFEETPAPVCAETGGAPISHGKSPGLTILK